MRTCKRHLVFMSGSVFLCCFVLAFGRDYTTESIETSTAKSVDGVTDVKLAHSSGRPVATYSTEDIAQVLTGTEPNAMIFSTSEVDQTEISPRIPNIPKTPNIPKSPESAACDTDYPSVAGELYIRPYGPYLAGRRWCSDGNRGRFWPGLWGMNIFYSWSDNSSCGEFAYWPYGYSYSWGDNPTSDFYPELSETEPGPNAYRPDQPVDANELPSEPLISEEKAESQYR